MAQPQAEMNKVENLPRVFKTQNKFEQIREQQKQTESRDEAQEY